MVSENSCPKCGAALPAGAINLAEGVALCERCGRLSRLSDVASRGRPTDELLAHPPSGCSVIAGERGTVVQATMRSLGGFLGSLAIALFWNGIVSIFVLIALAGLYVNLIGPLPSWFPAPSMKESMSMGMTLFLCVFLMPFILVGSAMVGALLLYAAGKTSVVIGDSGAFVSTGIGFLAWRRRFDPGQTRNVSLDYGRWESRGGQRKQFVVIDADRTVKFGSLLQDERREWMQAILHELLIETEHRGRRRIRSVDVRPRI